MSEPWTPIPPGHGDPTPVSHPIERDTVRLPPIPPPFRYEVGCVFLDGVARTESRHATLAAAQARSDALRRELREQGYTAHSSAVFVWDTDDYERGDLSAHDPEEG